VDLPTRVVTVRLLKVILSVNINMMIIIIVITVFFLGATVAQEQILSVLNLSDISSKIRNVIIIIISDLYSLIFSTEFVRMFIIYIHTDYPSDVLYIAPLNRKLNIHFMRQPC
jgi:hypothetical protein